jgi:cellulose biosynthesis protein BcsQ
MPALVVSIMNFKGGVGKTTLSVNLATALANSFKRDGEPYRVLVIDADSQANSSIYMLGEYWRKNVYPNQDKSLFGAIHRSLKGTTDSIGPEEIIGANPNAVNPIFSIEKGIDPDGRVEYRESSIHWTNLHLLPSHYNLVYLERLLRPNKIGKVNVKGIGKSVYYFEILDKIGKYINSYYDFVIIDCPPNLFYLSENALYFSDYILIPVIPDWLSTNGINWLVMQLYAMSKKYRRKSKSIKAIVPTLWTEDDPIYSRHIRILKKSLAIWKKNAKYAEILRETEVWEGLQRSQSVSKAIESLRPIEDFNSLEPARIQITRMVNQIINWRLP